MLQDEIDLAKWGMHQVNPSTISFRPKIDGCQTAKNCLGGIDRVNVVAFLVYVATAWANNLESLS